MKNNFLLIGLSVLATALSCTRAYDVVVIGGGAGGSMAAIEAARDGASVLVVEQTPWLGGMLTSAGVSAIDGNYRLRGGLFGEFTDSLAVRYGGYEALKSGWVSNILFNPAAGAEVLHNMATESGVDLRFRTGLIGLTKKNGAGNFPSRTARGLRRRYLWTVQSWAQWRKRLAVRNSGTGYRHRILPTLPL